MSSPHETVAAAVTAALVALMDDPGGPAVTREIDIPEFVPEAGLVNVRFEDPVELGRQLGTGTREWSRVAAVEIVVQSGDLADRIATFEAILAKVGGLADAPIAGIDWLDLGAPVDGDSVPIDGAGTIRSAVVEATLFYMTARNPMEAMT